MYGFVIHTYKFDFRSVARWLYSVMDIIRLCVIFTNHTAMFLSSEKLLKIHIFSIFLISILNLGNCSSFSGVDDSISLRDIQQKIKEEILKSSSAICKPITNIEDARNNCSVLAPTRNGIVRGFTQTSLANGSDVDVFLRVSINHTSSANLLFIEILITLLILLL